MLCQMFLSPQVKRCAIITYKHGVYELPHALPNGLRLRKLENIRKVSKLHRIPSLPVKMKIFLIKAKKFRKIAIKPFPWRIISHKN